jgi:hypothetical protein
MSDKGQRGRASRRLQNWRFRLYEAAFWFLSLGMDEPATQKATLNARDECLLRRGSQSQAAGPVAQYRPFRAGRELQHARGGE